MPRRSLRPLIPFASCILLPYGVVTTYTAIETQVQFWLFPLWTYVHDFGMWLRYGRVVPPFLASDMLLTSFLGLIWFAYGFCVSMATYRFYSRQIRTRWVLLSALSMLVLQSVVTIIASFSVWSDWILWAIPLPLHPLIVLFLPWIEARRVDDRQTHGVHSGNGRTSSVL